MSTRSTSSAGEEEVVTLRVREVVRETEDACSVIFDPPDGTVLTHRPGQFLTLAVPSERTGVVARCYSVSSAPGEPLRIAVKRTVNGYASNWINDQLRPGHEVRGLVPSGIFTPASLDADLLLLAAGSGVTPILGIARAALRDGAGKVVVLYANRDERSVIYASEWAALAAEHPDRLLVVHWLESVQGLPTQRQLAAFASAYTSYDAFVCGPAPFMKMAVGALKELGFPRERRHQEKFVSLGGNPFGDAPTPGAAEAEPPAAPQTERAHPARLRVELDGATYEYDDWDPGTKLLDFLEGKGVKAPYSCREGECSACAFRLLEGEVKLVHNDVLDREDLEDGIRLGCQALPVTDKVSVTYS